MATTPRKGKPFVWTSWITGPLAGSHQCLWAPWFKSRFKYDKAKSDFDLESWGADHDALVRRRIVEFEADGAKVRVENQNWVRLSGESAVLVAKPDAIAERGGLFIVADGKTGDPHKRDWWQMLIYLWAIPKAWEKPNLRMVGEIFYKAGNRIEVHPEELTQERRTELFGLIRRIGEPTAPVRTPSVPECSRCDIADCPERMSETATTSIAVNEF